jgi:hypothetical protein
MTGFYKEYDDTSGAYVSSAEDAAAAALVSKNAAAASATAAAASELSAGDQATAASLSQTNAATSETNAATSATNAEAAKVSAESARDSAEASSISAETAKVSAETAKVSAESARDTAAGSATTATTQAGIATTKAGEAATSATNAAATYNDLDDRYLGAKSSNPSTDNDGDALVTGALYFNTTTNDMKVWSGSAWLDAYASTSGTLAAANNLSDLDNVATARTNLGLGTAATTASTDYATAAQGTTADNALPKSGGAMSGAITTNSTFDGRNVATDGTKLDGIEVGATADQTAAEIKTAYESNADTNAFTDADNTKLAGIEASADVTDTANVTAAGALMDSELTSEASVKALDQGVATTDSPTFAAINVNGLVTSDDFQIDLGTTTASVQITSPSNIASVQQLSIKNTHTEGYLSFGTVLGQSTIKSLGAFGTADPLNINVGSTTAIGIDATGKVGIGTTSADEALEVSGDVKSSGGSFGIYHFGETSDVTKIVGRDASHGSFPNTMDFFTNSTQRIRIDSSGNVGIGITSPSAKLHVECASGSGGRVLFGGSTSSGYNTNINVTDTGMELWAQSNLRGITFSTGSTQTERMRIDSSGNLLVGTTTAPTALGTSTNSSDQGVGMSGGGRLSVANSNSYPLALNRYTSEGSLIQLNESGVTRGSIGIKGNEPFMVDTVAGLRMSGQGTANVLPVNSVGNGTNQALNLGSSTLSFDTVFADDFTNTSDRNYKQDIEELSEAELRVATACKGLMKKYRMKHAVVKKGDDARIHVGIIAQDLRDAFTAEGLDAGRYGMFVSETVWEDFVQVPAVEAVDAVYETQTDEEGNESQVLISEAIEAADGYTDVNHYWTEEEAPDTAVARTKMGVRYSQLLAFIIAAL